MGEINQEPSMEEILASIKRVIAEDNRPLPSRGARTVDAETGGEEPAEEDDDDLDDDVLELDDPMAEAEALISPDLAAASRQSLAQLAAMREHKEPGTVLPPANEGPLEAVVRDMLRPLLKQWLEQRLPNMVEDLVSREIARITGKRL